jgi:hypothetical protein
MGCKLSIAAAVAVSLNAAVALAGPEMLAAPQRAGQPGNVIEQTTVRETRVARPGPTPVPGVGGLTVYKEQFHYSSVVKRSYVPGYTPHATSRFENPREYPAALCVMATPYYQYAGIAGWFFGSPRGYQSSVPPGSHALAYHRGELGITDRLAHGYPEGLRVVEDVIVPYPAYGREGGFLIDAGAALPAAPGPAAAAEPVPLPSPTPQLAK